MFAEVLFVWGCRLFSESSCVGIILFSSPVQPPDKERDGRMLLAMPHQADGN